jgi:hypothetical protein
LGGPIKTGMLDANLALKLMIPYNQIDCFPCRRKAKLP